MVQTYREYFIWEPPGGDCPYCSEGIYSEFAFRAECSYAEGDFCKYCGRKVKTTIRLPDPTHYKILDELKNEIDFTL
ncbi:MAG: hypothetical protein ACOX6U_09195 [Oscillospiraceae bacterium]